MWIPYNRPMLYYKTFSVSCVKVTSSGIHTSTAAYWSVLLCSLQKVLYARADQRGSKILREIVHMYGTDKNGTAAQKITHFTLQPLWKLKVPFAHDIDFSTPFPPLLTFPVSTPIMCGLIVVSSWSMSHFTSLLLSLLQLSDAVLRDHKRSHIQERSTRQISTLVGSGIVLVYRQVTTFLLWSHPRPFPRLFQPCLQTIPTTTQSHS